MVRGVREGRESRVGERRREGEGESREGWWGVGREMVRKSA